MVQEPKKESEHLHEEGKRDKKEKSRTAQSRAEAEKKKEEKRDEESVILMGPAYTEEESTMQSLADLLPEQDVFEEESTQELYGESPPAVHEVHHHQSRKKHRFNTPRFVLGAVFIFIGLVFLVGSLELFNIANINILELWPLILIFLGFSIIFSKRWVSKTMVVAVAMLIVAFGLSVLFGDASNIGMQLSGNIIEEKRDVESFTSIVFLGAGYLIIEQGNEASLIVRADENVIENIKTEVLDKELNLTISRSLTDIFLYRKTIPTYIVTVTELDKITIIGSGSVQSNGISTDKLELSLDGSGNVQMKIESGEIVSRIFGSGAYTLTGTTTRQIIHIIGSGSYKAPHLQSLQAGVRITGSGDVLVNVREELNASVIGSGEIRYIGDPFISEESVQGSGTILRTRNEMGAEVGNLELLEQLKKIDAVTYPKIEQI